MRSRVERLGEVTGAGQRIVATTAYDFPTAALLGQAPLDFILVGDSVAMVVYGHETTRAATLDMMVAHTAAVRRGAPDRLVVADIPYPAMDAGTEAAAEAGTVLLDAGADAVKVEALPGYGGVVEALRLRGVPVMGHVGLLPQTVTGAAQYRVKGRGAEGEAVLAAALDLQERGAFAVVLECVAAPLGRAVTEALSIPTIGIGAGPHTDGQILVLHDLAGLTPGGLPRFVRIFGAGGTAVVTAVQAFVSAVQEGRFPSEEESYP